MCCTTIGLEETEPVPRKKDRRKERKKEIKEEMNKEKRKIESGKEEERKKEERKKCRGILRFKFIVNKKNQLDVTFCILYFSSTSCSTCFGQPCAHHQELTTA